MMKPFRLYNNVSSPLFSVVVLILLLLLILPPQSVQSFSQIVTPLRPPPTTKDSSFSSQQSLGPRLPINEDYPGLIQVYERPDIFLIRDFLTRKSCQQLMAEATQKGTMTTSPVAYAGWTTDFSELVELAAKGPVTWLSLVGAWWQITHNGDTDVSNVNQNIQLVLAAVQNFAILLSIAVAGIAGYLYARWQDLQSQRTSTSTTLDDLYESKATLEFVTKTAHLFHVDGNDNNNNNPSSFLQAAASFFEAPTIIRYEQNQVLKPHFDANRNEAANTEDANRGGQTLATLLVYLNDVSQGGNTRFATLPKSGATSRISDNDDNSDNDTMLTVQPKAGDALLFFPADSAGNFDDRTEHEGCPAVDEKWIARIWRHQHRVSPPFGLSEKQLQALQ